MRISDSPEIDDHSIYPKIDSPVRILSTTESLQLEWDIDVTRPFLSIAVIPGLFWAVAGGYAVYRLYGPNDGAWWVWLLGGLHVSLTLAGLAGAIYWMKARPLDEALSLSTDESLHWVRRMFVRANPSISPLSESILIIPRDAVGKPVSLSLAGRFNGAAQRTVIPVAVDQPESLRQDVITLVLWFIDRTGLPVPVCEHLPDEDDSSKEIVDATESTPASPVSVHGNPLTGPRGFENGGREIVDR